MEAILLGSAGQNPSDNGRSIIIPIPVNLPVDPVILDDRIDITSDRKCKDGKDGIDGIDGAGGTIEENVTVTGVGTLGGYKDGDVVLENTTLTNFIIKLLNKVNAPTYLNPSLTFSIVPANMREIGETLNYVLKPVFTQNDAGIANSIQFRYGLTILYTSNTVSDYTDTGRVVTAGSHNYSVEIGYNQGPIKNDNFGNPYPTGRIPANFIASSVSYIGAYYNWYGTYATLPTNNSGIRSLSKSYNNTFTLVTGNVRNIFLIAIPSTKTLISVIDEDALGANITSEYKLSGTIITVNDAGGVSVSYKIYILEAAIPYTTSHNHNVIIS